MGSDYTDLLARVEGLLAHAEEKRRRAEVNLLVPVFHPGVRVPLADLRALVAAVREMEQLVKDYDEARARVSELEDVGKECLEQRQRARKVEASLAHRQRLWSQLSSAILRRTTRVIREQYGGNTPEWINGETDELTAIFAEMERLRARVAELERFDIKFPERIVDCKPEGKQYDLLEWQAKLQEELGLARLRVAELEKAAREVLQEAAGFGHKRRESIERLRAVVGEES